MKISIQVSSVSRYVDKERGSVGVEVEREDELLHAFVLQVQVNVFHLGAFACHEKWGKAASV